MSRSSGTVRTTRSSSGSQLRKPSPPAASASTGIGASAPFRWVRSEFGVSPTNEKPAFRNELRLRGAGRRSEEGAENDGQAGDRVREGDIAVGPFLAALRLIRAVNGRLSASLLVLARLILLGKEHVEGNGRGIGLRQSIDDRRHRLARPWPTADALDRGVVDVDDPDRLLELVRVAASSADIDRKRGSRDWSGTAQAASRTRASGHRQGRRSGHRTATSATCADASLSLGKASDRQTIRDRRPLAAGAAKRC